MREQSPASTGILLYMVVVNLIKIILGGHLLEVTLHSLLAQVVHRIRLFISRYDIGISQSHIHQLIS